MKAIIHSAYGPPDELQLKDVEKPSPQDNEVRIKVHATSVTTSDCNIRNLTFVPKLLHFPMKLQFGVREPNIPILGFDFAGEIESTGKDVLRFKPGDQVFGTTEPAYGAHAQYICLPEDGVITHKPANLTYEEAAAVPVIGNTAQHFIRDMANVEAGQSVLINGASGGIGTYAVQLAKHYGANVTGVCSTKNLELVKSLGVDRVIDYTREDVTAGNKTYDTIFDTVGKLTFGSCRKILKEHGLFLSTLPQPAILFQMMWTSKFGSQKVKMEGAPARLDNLEDLKALIEEGKLRPVIDRRYPLEQVAEAFKYVEGGHKKGNVVITVDHGS